MKWMGRRESDNVEDRRKMSGGQMAIGGGAIGLIILLIQLFMGGDSSEVLKQVAQQTQQQQEQESDAPIDPKEEEMTKFVKVVLADNEDVWHKIFADNGMEYREPKLVLFRSAVESGCGNASSSTGPFYCPTDEKVYIDLSFFDELKERFGAPGDFAIAYVISHEVGHHVQNLLGTSDKVHNAEAEASKRNANKLSVALELQADFLAGVWAYHDQQMKDVLEAGDVDEALTAASAVGDDRLQKQAQGYVVPDAFTHGTSQQRMYWFKKGFEGGRLDDGDTFKELLHLTL